MQQTYCLNKLKLRTYWTFKHSYTTEPYLLCNIRHKYRSVTARLRNGTLPLRIETGRYTGLQPEDRKCTLCSDNVVEDEIHFVFDCSLYDDIRFMNRSTVIEPSEKLVQLFSRKHITIFSRCLYEMFIRRRNSISAT